MIIPPCAFPTLLLLVRKPLKSSSPDSSATGAKKDFQLRFYRSWLSLPLQLTNENGKFVGLMVIAGCATGKRQKRHTNGNLTAWRGEEVAHYAEEEASRIYNDWGWLRRVSRRSTLVGRNQVWVSRISAWWLTMQSHPDDSSTPAIHLASLHPHCFLAFCANRNLRHASLPFVRSKTKGI